MMPESQNNSLAKQNGSDPDQLLELQNFNELFRVVMKRRYKRLSMNEAAVHLASRIEKTAKDRDNLRNKIIGWLGRKVPSRVSARHLELIADHLSINKDPELKSTWDKMRDEAFTASAKSKGRQKNSGKSLDNSNGTASAQNSTLKPPAETEINPSTPSKEQIHPYIRDRSDETQEEDCHEELEYMPPAIYMNSRALRAVDKVPYSYISSRILIALFLVVGVSLTAAYFSYNQFFYDPGHECDLLAAAHWDTQKPIEIQGVSFGAIDKERAEKACTAAIAQRSHTDQEVARYHFQLGRIHDRKGDYINAGTEYVNSIKSQEYGASRLNLGILYENGQISGTPYPQQLDYRDLKQAAFHYKKAANSGLPFGRLCYAIAVLLGWDGNWDGVSDRPLAIPLAKDQLEQAKSTLDNLTTTYGYKDESRRARIIHLLDEINSAETKTRHVSCEQRAIVPIENERLRFR